MNDIEKALNAIGISAKYVTNNEGPTVTRHYIMPAADAIQKLQKKLEPLTVMLGVKAVNLIRTEIPGVVALEIPNRGRAKIGFISVLQDDNYKLAKCESALGIALGVNQTGAPVVCDIAQMPHLLIAGTTGSGKSVLMHTISAGLILQYSPEELRLVMIDPKRVEFSAYRDERHLLTPVINDADDAKTALRQAVDVMESRYAMLDEAGANNIDAYNRQAKKTGGEIMPRIVIMIDEFADLMMTSKKDFESDIVRIAQKGRAAGIYLVIATQRPTVNVITGLIKANIPSRIALTVSSATDSRVILDKPGAEKLLGKGDMLYSPVGAEPVRVQGCNIEMDEVKQIVAANKATPETEATAKRMGFDLKEDDKHIEEIKEMLRMSMTMADLKIVR